MAAAPGSWPRRHRTLAGLAGALVAGATMGGCAAVGPDFDRPAPPPGARYETAGEGAASLDAAAGGSQRLVPDDPPQRWWTMYGSARLDALVDAALAANPTLPAARAALRAAQALADAQRGAFAPQVVAGAGPARVRTPGVLASGAASGDPLYTLHTAQLTVSYSPDVFGANRRAVESLAAQADVQRAQLAAARIAVAGNVVVAAISEASLRAQIASVETVVTLQRDQLGVFQRQFDLGAGSMVEVSAQRTALAQTQATVPPLRRQLLVQQDLVAALTGRRPDEPPIARVDLDELRLPDEVPVGVPSTLLARRPDVQAAEAAMHAASAQVGIARAARLPSVPITATFGATAATLAALSGPGAAFWSVGAGVAQTVFAGGALQARERAALAGSEQAAAQYRATVLAAFQNVADALGALRTDADALAAQIEAERRADESLGLVQAGFGLGSQGYLAVLVAQQSVAQARVATVQAQAARLADTAALIVAAGGGWRDGPADTADTAELH